MSPYRIVAKWYVVAITHNKKDGGQESLLKGGEYYELREIASRIHFEWLKCHWLRTHKTNTQKLQKVERFCLR